MCKLFFILTLNFLFTGLVYPQGETVKESREYTVWLWQENRDCLWNIAKKFYGDGSKWRIIYEANKDEIQNPGKIFPKQRLKIPVLRGEYKSDYE
ncbi:MAG: LysM peptidoglycan-binding domain-containing protein [Elusimicrobiota bacterium]